MALIDSRNILDLIGKHRGKYHSCILTCYSLDFSFFEERVLPVLRTANIKNVNVFADGRFLEQAQENTTGKEFKYNKTYNFLPVYTIGVFHPKILLLTGVKHGLLIIGSGNITSSGISTNDEIWGAFHLDNNSNENALIFSNVWHYLQQFVKPTYGTIHQKISWIETYSPWLLDISHTIKETTLESLNQTVEFVSNSKEKSILQIVQEKVPVRDLDSITVISPFYDLKGLLIKSLLDHYKPRTFNCVIDSQYGTIPKSIDEVTLNSINFYDWGDCKSDYNSVCNRLHAKILHFRYSDGREYLLLGSANATDAAMGTSSKRPVNHEAGLIINRIGKGSWLKDLDINLPNVPVSLLSIKTNNVYNGELKSTKNYLIKIFYSELNADDLSIYLKTSIEHPEGIIKLVNRSGAEIEKIPLILTSDKVVITCNVPVDLFKVYIINSEGDHISNFSIVHRTESLLRCNPDPQHEKLDLLLEKDYSNGEGLSDLLQFVDYNWADEDTNPTYSGISNGRRGTSDSNSPPSNGYEKLSSKEFNTPVGDLELQQSIGSNSSNLKIAAFLAIIISGNRQASDDNFSESEEQKLLEDEEQKGEGVALSSGIKIKNWAIKEKAVISRYYKRLNELYYKKLEKFYESSALTESPKEVLTITALSNILIAVQLIHNYHGKKFTVEVGPDASPEETTKEVMYLTEGDLYSGPDTIKGFLIDVLGRFILLATAGMKEYSYAPLNHKLIYNSRQLLIRSIMIMLKLKWKENELIYRDSLYLNLLFYLNPSLEDIKEFEEGILNSIELQKNELVISTSIFNDNYEHFKSEILIPFVEWYSSFKNVKTRTENLFRKTDTIRNGNWIFNSKLGFNYVSKTNRNADTPILNFIRAGYNFNERLDASILEDISYGKLCIFYRGFTQKPYLGSVEVKGLPIITAME